MRRLHPDRPRPAPPGLEWRILRRLPAIALWGTAVPLLLAVVLGWRPFAHPDGGWFDLALNGTGLWVYGLLGFVLFYWTAVLTVAIGCGVVHIMKGPAFVADSYPPEGR